MSEDQWNRSENGRRVSPGLGVSRSGCSVAARVRWVVACLALTLVAVFGFAGPASASPPGYRVLIVHSNTDGPPTTLRNEIAAFPDIASVDVWDAHVSTPTAAQLEAYDLVVSQSGDNQDLDPAGVGNALADYYDDGGVVIQFAWDNDSNSGYAPTGRWASGGYQPFIPGPAPNSPSTLGVHSTTSPLMQGVNALASNYNTDPTLAPGATLLAKWADGRDLIAVKGRAVSVSAYVGDEGGSSWSGDFAQLAVNTVRVGKPSLSVTKTGTGAGTVSSSPGGINCGTACSAHYTNGSSVKLTASASPGSAFTGWSGGGCSGASSTCTVTMSAATTVTATFVSPPNKTTITGAKIKKKKHTARFKFTASGAISGWQCALVRPKKNGKLPKKPKLKWRSCKSPKLYKHLKHGHYKFEVRATNSAGPDPNPAIKKFTI